MGWTRGEMLRRPGKAQLLIYALKEAEQRLSRASLHRKGIQAPPPRYGPEGSSAPRVARGTDPRLEWVGTQPPTMHQLMKAMAFLQQAQYDRVDREKPLRRLLLRWPEILTYDVTTQCIPVTSALLDAGVDFADVLRMVQIFPPILLLPPATVTERLRHLERLGLTLSQRSTLAGVMPHVVLGKKPEELRNRLGVIQYTHKIGPQEAAQYMYETLMQELPNSSRLDRLENRVVWWEEYVQTEEEILYQPSSAGNEVHLYDVPQSPSRGLHGKQVFRNRPSTGRQRERQAKVASRTRGTGKRPSSKHWIRPSKGNGS